MPLSFMKDTVTVLRAGRSSKRGMEHFDWSDPEEITLTNVQVIGQGTSREFGDRVLNVSDRRTLRALYDADIQAGDRVIWNGDTYEIEGEVYHTKSPTGRVSSTRCTLARWVG